jgi:hypothetical protein
MNYDPHITSKLPDVFDNYNEIYRFSIRLSPLETMKILKSYLYSVGVAIYKIDIPVVKEFIKQIFEQILQFSKLTSNYSKVDFRVFRGDGIVVESDNNGFDTNITKEELTDGYDPLDETGEFNAGTFDTFDYNGENNHDDE